MNRMSVGKHYHKQTKRDQYLVALPIVKVIPLSHFISTGHHLSPVHYYLNLLLPLRFPACKDCPRPAPPRGNVRRDVIALPLEQALILRPP